MKRNTTTITRWAAAILVATGGWFAAAPASAQERKIGAIRNAPERRVGIVGQPQRRPLSSFFVNTESTRLVDLRRSLGVDRDEVFVGGIRPQPTPFTLEGIRNRAQIDNPVYARNPRFDNRRSNLGIVRTEGVHPKMQRVVSQNGIVSLHRRADFRTQRANTQASFQRFTRPAYTTQRIQTLNRPLQRGQLVLSVGNRRPVLITQKKHVLKKH
ncbi:MAG: hypothetical protein AAF288_05610 [Planctomycetota bacterium]